MKETISNWRKFLLSEAQNHYEVEILLKYSPDMSLYGDVFNKVRAIPGVTIVKKREEDYVRNIGAQKIVKLSVKFIPPRALMGRYLQILKFHMLKIKDEGGDKVLGVRFISQPSATDK